MFIITLTYKVQIEEVLRLLTAHNQFLDKYYEAGYFIASGPQVPRTGGVILCKVNDGALLRQILSEDPFNEIADYNIMEFEVNKCTSEFGRLLK